jgi:hypothetical protein
MDELGRPPDHPLRRLPGLFRRWELGQVIEAGKDYRVEDAGSACDGTTLYAVYAGAATVAEAEIEKNAEAPSTPGDPLDAERAARGGPWGRPSDQKPHFDAIQSTKAAR